MRKDDLMVGWLIVNGFLNTPKFRDLYDMFQESAKKLSVDLILKGNDEILVDISSDNNYYKDLNKPDFVLFWDKDVKLARYFEKLGIRVFNPAKAIAICDDKSLTHLELMNSGIKMPMTMVAPMTFTNVGYTNFDFLELVKLKFKFPFVIKEVFGSFGQQVYLINDENELEKVVKQHSDSSLIFQEYIKSSKGQDVRLQVVGSEVVAAMYRYNDTGDFRANVSNGGKMKFYTPTNEQIDLAVKSCKIIGLDFAGVDLLFGQKDEPILCEINSNAHFKNITDVTGVSVSDKIIEYIVDVCNKEDEK